MIAPTVARLDAMIAEPRPGPGVGWAEDDNWSWCDALVMAPPTIALIAEGTGDRRFLDLMNAMWWEASGYLYDETEHLWYRDGRYLIQPDGSGPRTPNGKQVFWSRGNGSVFAGLALVLEHVPADYPDRPRYEQLFRDMARALVAVQGEDGLWRSSLLDPDEFPIPESSGSGFFTFGLAWGVNHLGGLVVEGHFPPEPALADLVPVVRGVDDERVLRQAQRLREEIGGLKKTVAALEDRVVRVEDRVMILKDRVQTLEDRDVTLKDRIAALEDRVAALERRVA